MTSLYDILKANRLGMDSDPWVAMLGEAWKASEEEYQEYTGLVPYTFIANGQPLIDWYIKGNTEHTGTPSPQNPVMPNGVGERTENLLDLNSWFTEVNAVQCTKELIYSGISITATASDAYVGDAVKSSTGIIPSYRRAQLIPVEGNTEYTLSLSSSPKCYLSFAAADYTILNDDYYRITQSNSPINYTFTTPNNCAYILLRLGKEMNPGDTYSFTNLMLVKGTVVPSSYEPYGYKIPISSGGVTTNIYLGSTQTVRQIKKLVLDGTENWVTTGNANVYRLQVDGYYRSVSYVPICTHYQGISVVDQISRIGNNQTAFLLSSSGNNYYYIRDDTLTTLSDFTAYLSQQYAAGTPVIVWYVLATPETAAVNEPLMKIGDYADSVSAEQAGVEIPTNKGNTVIDVETELKPSEFYMKWKGR